MRVKNAVTQEFRERMIKSSIGFGELSDALGVSESTLYRWFRHELTQKQRQAITIALTQLEEVA